MRNLLKDYRIQFGYLLFVIFIVFATFNTLYFTVGAILSILSLIWRFWASGYISKNSALTIGGPYRYCRHPLYWGNFLMGLGFSLMCGKIIFVLVFILFFLTAYFPLMKDEEKKLIGIFGDRYLNYIRDVPMFVPFWSKTTGDPVPFSLERVLKNKEYRAWFGFFIFLVGLLIKFSLSGF